jgi:hypothetical protein
MWSFTRRLVPRHANGRSTARVWDARPCHGQDSQVPREPSAADGLAAPELASAPHLAPQQAAAVSLATLPRTRPL